MEKINNQNQLGQFMVNYNQQMKSILEQSQRQMGNMLQKFDYSDVINKLIETVDEVIEDNAKLKRYVADIQEENKTIKHELDETKGSLENMNNKYGVLYGATYVIATDDEKRKDMYKEMNKRAYHACKGKNSIMDKLFHQAITKACYGRLYQKFNVGAYTRIKIDDFEDAMLEIECWYKNIHNIRKAVDKRLDDYMKDLDKGVLGDEKEKLLDKYLDRTDNGTKDFE